MKPTLETMRDVPAQILCLAATPPLIRSGRVLRCQDAEVEMELREPEAGFREGLHVVLAGGGEKPFRFLGVVCGADGRRLRVRVERVVEADKRDFPRLQAGLSVRYRKVGGAGDAEAARAWVDGGEPPAGGEWHVPDPFMDFSGSGLRFEDRLCCGEGDLLLLEMQIPPSGNRWRATARVVRLIPIRGEEEGAQGRDRPEGARTHQIAVAFEQVPREAAEALAEYALRIQDALLKI